MKKFLIPALLAAASAIPSSAHAALLLFTITGDYNASFQVEASPIPDSAIPGFGFMLSDVPGFADSLTGTANVSFFSDAIGGGINIREPLRFFNLLNAVGPQLYTGAEEAPTFKVGVFDLIGFDGTGSYQLTIGNAVTPVPEAPTWALMIGGMALAGAALRRRSTQTIAVRFQHV